MSFRNSCLATIGFFLCAIILTPTHASGALDSLILQGILDLDVPSGGSDGKALHFLAVEDVDDGDMSDAAKAMLEGVAATERDLQASLQRHKVMPINPMGEKFDPNQHEALFEAPGTGQPSGTVIEVVEIGYMMEERLLRPAKVGLAKD